MKSREVEKSPKKYQKYPFTDYELNHFQGERPESFCCRRRRGGWGETCPVQPGETQRGQAGGAPGRVGLHLQHQVQPGDFQR